MHFPSMTSVELAHPRAGRSLGHPDKDLDHLPKSCQALPDEWVNTPGDGEHVSSDDSSFSLLMALTLRMSFLLLN